MDSESYWRRLGKAYKENGIALALGAGLSVGSNLPNWNQLLRRIAENCFGENHKQLVDEMINDGFSLPAIAGILEAQCPAGKDFAEVIRDALYRDFKFYRMDSRHDPTQFVNFIKTSNPTLSAVAALCATKGADSTYTANPFVHAIANANFDAILRVYSSSRHAPAILRTVDRPSARALYGRINVYHVHGFFQFDGASLGKRSKEAPDIRVFTEHEYFDFFNQPNSLFSYTFLHLLREFTMLFIGMSLKDDNIRRLLHYSRKEISESYQKEGESIEDAQRKSLRHYAIQQRSTSEQLNQFVETSLRRLGVRALWVDDYKEIPSRLKDLYESTGLVWSDVY